MKFSSIATFFLSLLITTAYAELWEYADGSGTVELSEDQVIAPSPAAFGTSQKRDAMPELDIEFTGSGVGTLIERSEALTSVNCPAPNRSCPAGYCCGPQGFYCCRNQVFCSKRPIGDCCKRGACLGRKFCCGAHECCPGGTRCVKRPGRNGCAR